jgi:hypothetical protein
MQWIAVTQVHEAVAGIEKCGAAARALRFWLVSTGRANAMV